MLNWLLKRKSPKSQENWCRAQQTPGVKFPFPKGSVLIPEEEMMLAFPASVIHDDEKIGSVLLCDDNAELTLNDKLGAWYVKLKPGMKFALTRSCEIIIIAGDKRSRFFQLMLPERK